MILSLTFTCDHVILIFCNLYQYYNLQISVRLAVNHVRLTSVLLLQNVALL